MKAEIRRLVSTDLICMAAMPAVADDDRTRAPILSGANNHDWRETTPVIKATLEETGKFLVDVEENVGTMRPDGFAPYAVILSNHNTFGKEARKETWSAETKRAFVDHMAKGNGLVIIHAGSSVFYDWPEFQTLATVTPDPAFHGSGGRGTEWAATGKVTLAPAKYWPATREDAERMTR